ncbi:MAG: putative Type pilus assembly protein PilP [Nitrospira sp.]|jgi:type IV pilus assembly protein PilP|nr:putative Type pilus assembly protein PilP [Nitrospira sp.]
MQAWWKDCIQVTIAGAVALVFGAIAPSAEAKNLSHLRQVAAMRQADSIKVPAFPDAHKPPPIVEPSLSASEAVVPPAGDLSSSEFSGTSYDPSGRRDPFLPMYQPGQPLESDSNLPPLQRVGLTELSLIGVIWGNYGYTAMVQTPDGKGYSIRRGTRIGPNNGVVSSITERGIIVQERFTDVYGNKQEREYVKLLHPKEGTE